MLMIVHHADAGEGSIRVTPIPHDHHLPVDLNQAQARLTGQRESSHQEAMPLAMLLAQHQSPTSVITRVLMILISSFPRMIALSATSCLCLRPFP